MSNRYRYYTHQDLTPTELFFFMMIDQTRKQLGINDVESVILILSGLPLLPTRQKFAGATKGTSIASLVSRTLFKYQFKKNILPTLTLNSMKSLKILFARRLGVFIGRTIPGVGWVLLAHDVFLIGEYSVLKYNSMVKAEDRIL